MAYFNVSLLTLICILNGAIASEASDALQGPGGQLLKFVQERSHPMLRPVANHSDTLFVDVGLSLHTVIALESTVQTLHSDIWLRLAWHNYRATWEPQDYNGIDKIHMSANDVWVPDIIVYNAISKTQSLDGRKHDFTLTVESNGMTRWNYPLVTKTSCSLNMTYFPVDIQDCFIEISTWSYTGREVRIRNNSATINLDSITDNGEFKLLSTKVAPYEEYYECCPNEPYYGIKYHVILKRLPAFYILNIYLPSLLMLVLAIFGNLLPAESEGKLTLAVTIFLSQIFMVMVVTEYAPVQSLSIPFLTKYMLNLLIMMTVYIGICVCIVRMRTHARASVHVSPLLRMVFLNPAMLCLFFPVRWRQHQKRMRDKAAKAEVQNTFENVRRLSQIVSANVWHKEEKRPENGFDGGVNDIENSHISASNSHQTGNHSGFSNNGSIPDDAVCHKDTFDLLSLNEWVLVALIWERFWNTLLIVFTISGFIWNVGIIKCQTKGDCPDTMYNTWPW